MQQERDELIRALRAELIVEVDKDSHVAGQTNDIGDNSIFVASFCRVK